MRQIDLWRVDNFFRRIIAARHTDCLRSMMCLLATGASRLTGLRAAAVSGLRELVPGVIDYVELLALRQRGNLQV
jgi:multisubunit Na+/H+ antiporter MnhG subunit